MQAIILCGGRGERLMPLTAKRPASLLRIMGRELIFYTMDELIKAGADRITLAIGYGGAQLKSLFDTGEYRGVPVDFSSCTEDGTTCAVAYAADRDQQEILLVEGNSLFCGDLSVIIQNHRSRSSLCTALICENDSSGECPAVSVDLNGEITSVIFSPAPSVSGIKGYLGGIYVFSPDIFTDVNFAAGKDFTADILPELAKKGGRLMGRMADFVCDKIITPKGFLTAQMNMLKNTGTKITSLTSDNFSGVTFIPPVWIGKNVSIAAGSIVGRGTVIDNGARIGSRCKITGSYIGENSAADDYCEIECSVLSKGVMAGSRVNIGKYSCCGEDSVLQPESRLCTNTSIWADTTVKSGVVVRDNLTHGNGSEMYIDDDGNFTLPHIAMSALNALYFGMACASSLNKGDTAVVGRSSKAGSELYLSSMKTGLANCGVNVLDIGECTPPMLAYASKVLKGSIALYADLNSHCSIKTMSQGGLPLKRDLERSIENNYRRRSFRSCTADTFGKSFDMNGAGLLYENYLRTLIPHKLKGVNAQIRSSDRIISAYADSALKGANDINGERITFHISFDGSKCTAYSESAGNVTWENLVCLALTAAFDKGESVALPYCFPSSADRIAENLCGRLYRYHNCSCGFDEDARHIAAEDCNMFVRDGLSLALKVCCYLSEKKLTLGKALGDLPLVYSSQRYVASPFNIRQIRKIFPDSCENMGEGIVYENSTSRAIIRPLKDHSGIMIFAESMQCEYASAICDEICEKIKFIENNADNSER